MTLNLQPVLDFAKKTGTSVKNALAPTCKRISESYSEYDINVTKTSHLTPNDVDENGNEQNVVTETCNTKLKLNLKDVLCALVVVAVVVTAVKAIADSICKD